MRVLTLLCCLFAITFSGIQAQNDTNTVKELHKKIKGFQKLDLIDSISLYEQKAFEISEKIGYEYGITHALTSFGLIYRIKGDYPKALANFFKALAIYEKNKDDYHILVQISNIATVYYFQGESKKAKAYYLRAIALSKKIGDKNIESDNLCNMSGLYNDEQDYTNAERCLREALQIDREMGNEQGMAHVLADLGQLYISMRKYEKALSFAEEALVISTKLDYIVLIPVSYKTLAQASFGLNNIKDAEAYFQKALASAEEQHDMNDKMQIEGALSEFYEQTGRPGKAFLHYRAHIQYRDSMYNQENTRKLVETEMNYTFDKKQAALKFENDKVVYQLEAENKLHKQWRFFFIILIVLALIALFFVKRAYDNKKKLARLLEAEDQRKDVLLQEVHHRINNNLQIISSLLTLQASHADNEKLSGYLVQSQNRIQSLSALHELLYDTNAPLEINMKDYIAKVLDFHRDVASSLPQDIRIEARVESVDFPTGLAVPIALVINELVTNAIKYAFAGRQQGMISVSLRKNEPGNNWIVTVEDNGVGFTPDTDRKKDSLGLKLVNIMTRQIGGLFEAKNEDGAHFNLIFSLAKKN